MAGKTLPKDRESLFYAAAKTLKCTCAVFFGFLGPLFQPACFRQFANTGCKSGRMRHHPEQNKVRVHFAVEDGLDIELEERLSRQRLTVSENSKAQAIGHYAPQMAGTAV